MMRSFTILYFAAFLDLCGVSMIVTQLPSFLRQLGASHSEVGVIGSIYGFVQFFSSPVVGSFADAYGKKLMLLFCMLNCGVGYFCLGVMPVIWITAVLRVYLGVFKHPLNLIKSALSDLSIGNSQLEAEVNGYYQSACSIAFIVGPAISGHVMELPNGFAVIGTCVAVVNILNMSDGQKVGLALMMRFCLGFSGLLFRNSSTLLYKDVYQLSHSQIGWLVSFNAFVQASIGFIMKYISMVLTDSLQQLVTSCLLYSTITAMMAVSTSHYNLIALTALLSVATMINKVSSVTFTLEQVGQGHSATVVGVVASLMSLARFTTPIIAGILVEHYGLVFPLYITSSSALLAAALSIFIHKAFKAKTE